ncbi:MAG: calcium-binding protein, partial [Candidatus Accumulibacter meliphilus]
ADTMIGGDGSDVYTVDQSGDVVSETNAAAAGGTDLVNTLVNYTLGANVENLRIIASGAVNGTGNALDNIIYAGAGNNVLDGGAGTDTLSYTYATAGVTVSLATAAAQVTGGSGTDTVLNFENLTGSDFNDKLTGDTNANTLTGGLGNDTLNGGTGADTMIGGDGSDLYYVDHVGDVVSETNAAAAGGTDTVYTVVHHTLGANVENLRITASGAVNGTGNALNNIIYAGAGNNVLDGGAGTDTLSYAYATAGVTVSLAIATPQVTGGSGTDTVLNFENLTGSAFNDVLTGNAGNNSLQGGLGDDILDGGAGSDTVDGSNGDDRGIYRPSTASVGDSDIYKGNVGSDTLSLELTHTELNDTQVQADLRAYEQFINLNGNVAAAAGAEYQFTAFSLKASTWEHLDLTDTNGMIWRNGAAGVTIGTAGARTIVQIGTNEAAPTGNVWTGAVPSGSDNWSIADNWQDISVPTSADTVVFNAIDPGGRSVVDTAFQGTIAGLVDTGEAAHAVEFQRALQVDGPASVHTGNAQDTGSLTILNTLVELHLTDLNVGINAAGSGMATGYLLLNSGAVVDATDVGGVSVGAASGGSAYGTVRLAGNSTLNVGTEAALADVNIGYAYNWDATPTGVLDALDAAATINLHLDGLFVGRSSHSGAVAARGTLRWNQDEVIDANGVYFGHGGGATGVLDVPTGGTLLLGSASDPVGLLDIADNATGGADTTADLDFSVTNPMFAAYIGNELRIGSAAASSSSGELVLASNSALNVGTEAALADVNIGYAYNWDATPTGVLDALDAAATINLHLDGLFVGRSSHSGAVAARGTFLMGEGVTGDANSVAIGAGTGATGLVDIVGGSLHAVTLTLASGTLDVNDQPLIIGSTGALNAQTLDLAGGLLTGQSVAINGGTFNFSGGVLAVDTFTGLLEQDGGVLAPGNSVGQTTVSGNYALASAGTLSIEIFGSTFNTTTKLYDRLAVNGTVNLNADSNAGGGGTLDVHLGYSPSVGSAFTILTNDGSDAVSARFKGLLEGATFNTAYGGQTVTFQISYSGGTGNDIVLTVTNKTGTAPTGLTVTGTADSELLSGSVGADTFTGLGGNDIFTGWLGNDLFTFDVGCGFDRINDFSPGSDHLQLNIALGVDSFAALDSNSNGVLDDADELVIVAGNDTILMFGTDQIDIVGQTALHSTDFLFV